MATSTGSSATLIDIPTYGNSIMHTNNLLGGLFLDWTLTSLPTDLGSYIQ